MSSKESDIRRYLNSKFDGDAVKQKLATYTNAANTDLFNVDKYQETKIQIRPDNSVAAAMFKPDLLHPGHYKAHPATIRAMRRELFMGGEDFVDLEVIVECSNCKKTMDLQFWKCCPYCESELKHP